MTLEVDWEQDINFGLGPTNTRTDVFRKNNLFSLESEMDFTLAYERYKYPQPTYFEDDDTNSSVTSGSVISSRFSELDTGINDLDDYLASPTTPTLLFTSVAKQDLGQFSGIIQRVTVHSQFKEELQDNDDWTQDIEMPTGGMAHIKAPTKEYEEQLPSLDDDVQDFEHLLEKKKQSKAEPTLLAPPKKPSHLFRYEPERDEDDMSGLDFPTDLTHLPKVLDDKKKGTFKSLLRTPLPAKTASTTRIPVKASSKLPTSIKRENDDDDFCDGLYIKEKAFSFNTRATKVPTATKLRLPVVSTQQPTRKGKEPISRLARPSPLLQNSTRQSDHAASLAKRTLDQPNLNVKPRVTTSKLTTVASTRASRLREIDTTVNKITPQKNSPYLTINRSSLNKPIQNNEVHSTPKKSPAGYTLIAVPKARPTKYVSRLDGIDNLNDLQPKPFIKRTTYKLPSQENKPWRQNKPSTDRSRVKLIQPSEKDLKTEYNNMTYDNSNHCWKGNEKSLDVFQEGPTYKRPMLIMNKQKKNEPSRYAAVKGSAMIFNNQLQKWISSQGQHEECNELDTIEDLKEGPVSSIKSSKHSIGPYKRIQTPEVDLLMDFRLTVDMKRSMMYQQEQHERWMENWPF